MFETGTVITDGTVQATVLFSSETFVVVETDSGEVVLGGDALNAWSEVAEASAAFTILHPHVVYRLDGTRVDGYANRDRAIRRNTRRFPNGFVLVDSNTAVQETFNA